MKTIKIGYFDREGGQITKDEWTVRQLNEEYRTVRLYDNGKVRLRVYWEGSINLPDDSFRDCWPMFSLLALNYNSVGLVVTDPMSGKTFPDEESAVAAYEEFLVKWTNCTTDDFGGFSEVDNDEAPPPPPPPPNLDLPISKMKNMNLDDEGVGAW